MVDLIRSRLCSSARTTAGAASWLQALDGGSGCTGRMGSYPVIQWRDGGNCSSTTVRSRPWNGPGFQTTIYDELQDNPLRGQVQSKSGPMLMFSKRYDYPENPRSGFLLWDGSARMPTQIVPTFREPTSDPPAVHRPPKPRMAHPKRLQLTTFVAARSLPN